MSGLNTLSFIKANSLSFTEIQRDIQEFINALSEDEKLGFKTLFEGTNSQILIEMIAAKSSDEIYHIITSRSENLLYYCNRLDSAIAIAQNYAYSATRGTNIQVQLTVVPSETIILPKLTVIGTADDYSLITAEDISLTENVSTKINAYIGNLNEQTLTADSEDLLLFRYTNQNISSQYALYLNNVEVPTTENIIEMLDDKYFCITNAYSGVDVIYLNRNTDFVNRYSNGSELTLKYIEYSDITLSSIDLMFDYGDITNVIQLNTTQKPESVNSIRQRAQLYSETQNRIVARDDFYKVFLDSNPEIANAVGKDFSSAQVEVTYVKKDGSLLTDQQYTTAYNNLYNRRAYGIPMCLLSHPDVMLNLNVSVILQVYSGSTANIETYVRKVLSKYELILGEKINFSTIEHDLEGYDFVKVARIVPVYQTFTTKSLITEGTILEPTIPNGKLYVVRNALFLSNTSEPNWPTTIGSTIEDNDIIWECQEKSYVSHPEWKASTSYILQSIVIPTDAASEYQYKCVGFTYKTGTTEPVWPSEVGDFVEDNQILWVAVSKNLTAEPWTASTITTKGTTVNGTEETDVSYQAINYIPTTSALEPEWSTIPGIFSYRKVQYVVIDKEFDDKNPSASDIQLKWNQYALFNETVTVL